MKIVIENYWPYYFTKVSYPLIVLVYDAKGNPCFGVVLLKYLLNKSYEVVGNVTGYNIAGPVFSDPRLIKPALEIISQKIQSPIHWFKIYPDNPLIKFAKNNPLPYKAARIIISQPYNDYFKDLSKSVRQNIRTAYNRLNTDNLSYKMITLDNVGYNCHLDEIQSLSSKRHFERYGSKTSLPKKLFMKYLSFATIIYKKSPNSLSFLLYIDNKPAAMMNGLIKGNHYIIPRLAIDAEFKRYSPGMILVNEAIKSLLSFNESIIFDLSYGQEKYKFDFDAESYSCFSFLT